MQNVLEWLENTAEKLPEKVAFFDVDNNSITFSEIMKKAKSVGTYISKFTSPKKPVIVMTGKHIETPVCFMGVVYSGCFYAPIDADMPVERLNNILKVIQSDLMIVDSEHAEYAEKLDFGGKILKLEDAINEVSDETILNNIKTQVTESSPLYVIFTSGSTGVPKGVITSHASLINYIEAVSSVMKINSADIMGNQSPLDYIAAVRDIYFPLKTGASTLIIPKNYFSVPAKLFDTLREHKVTALCWSVSALTLTASLGAFDHCVPSSIKKVCFSGSVMPCKLLKIWQKNLPDAIFINQYGPTEATASCTYYVIDHEVEENEILPIGVPYKNYYILLLNDDLTATKPGDTGEICVGGSGVTLGYYNNPEKTKASFIQNPLNSAYREIIYKTGDNGCLREDGILEFRGRRDRQIKHFGHRVELDELDFLAKTIDGVTDACTLFREDKEMIYLFYTGEAQTKEIVICYRSKLPAFMVPRKLIKLEAMPKLPNGKIDMQELKKYFN